MEDPERMELKTEDGLAETATSGKCCDETHATLALKGWRGLGYQSEGEESDGKRWEEGESDEEESESRESEANGESSFKKAANRDNEVVILVIGNEQSHKQGIVQAITKRESESWTEDVSLAGTRILTRENPRRKIIDTTPLIYVSGKSPTAIGRRWISHNSLRRVIVKKFVLGVCVITSSVLEAPCTSSVFGYDNCWVDVLRIIFRAQKHGIMFIFKHDKELDDSTKKKVTRFIRNHDFDPKNIIFSGSDNDVMTVLEDSVGLQSYARVAKKNGFLLFLEKLFSFVRGNGRQRLGGARTDPGLRKAGWGNQYIRLTSPLFVVTPFFMDEARSARKTLGAWSSERIILFGRTGSGKSTLAQMLTTGRLDPDSSAFKASSSIRGMTKTIEQGEGRGWYIVDTPGFGESQGKDSTISTEEVQAKLKKFVDLVEGTFAHYMFVVKKDRVDQLEVNLWKFFQLLFGEDISSQFSIIFSNASQDWLDENRIHLQQSFAGCRSLLCAEFPTMHDFENDGLSQDLQLQMMVQEENETVRMESLSRLEQELAKLDRCDRACKYGKNSRVSKMLERSRANSDMKVERSLRTKMIYQGSEALFRVDEVVSTLIRHLTINDRVSLVPLIL